MIGRAHMRETCYDLLLSYAHATEVLWLQAHTLYR